MGKTLSPANSFKGWGLGQWIIGNWSTIKEAIKVGVPYLASTYFTGNLALQGLITAAGKLVLDAGEYYIKQRKA